MLYVIYAQDIADSLEKRLSVRPAHLARLQLLHDEGRLLTAGPMPAVDSNDPGAAGFTGSTVIAEFESLEAAQAWASRSVCCGGRICAGFSKTLQESILTKQTAIFIYKNTEQ